MGGLTAAQYREHLLSLLPRGPAWCLERGTELWLFVDGLAQEFARVDARVVAMITESHPGKAYETLSEWEGCVGLPDKCTPSGAEISERQAALVNKLGGGGGQSIPYYIKMLADLGYPGVTIDEPWPMTCNDDCNDVLWSEEAIFCWIINMPASTAVTLMTCNDNCNSALSRFGVAAIECIINRVKQSHTFAVIRYVG